ncbi:MAG: prepilin-type N-terminal cleavage/methylation domain-containing protein, partial [Bacilli bacterium]|nr:prepilin-type N-terminal cleavage/methylation domain-containing protein [Bacilli bacterium]
MATEGGGLENKAFTLIELLAVIIIIGMIALITVPIVMG